MRDLDLAARVPTKTRDDDAAKMFNAKLTLSKAFTLFTLMVHGPRHLQVMGVSNGSNGSNM